MWSRETARRRLLACLLGGELFPVPFCYAGVWARLSTGPGDIDWSARL